MKKVINTLSNYYYVLRYTPAKQLFFRVFLVAKRRILERLYLLKIYRIYPNTYQLLNVRDNVPIGSIFGTSNDGEKLPIYINLAGYRYYLGKNIDWYPANLDHGTRLERLNLHYMDYLHKLEYIDAIEIILDWIDNVPPYQRNYWQDSWNSFALSIRIINWIDILTTCKSSITDSAKKKIEKSMIDQIDFLFSNLELDIKGNHLFKNLRCIFRASSYFKGREVRTWIQRAGVLLLEEMKVQVLEDGMHFELSPCYHNQVLEDLLCIRRSLISIKDDDLAFISENLILQKIDSNIYKMSKVSKLFIHPDGLPSLFADGGLHMGTNPSKLQRISNNYLNQRNSVATSKITKCWALRKAGYYGLLGKTSSFIIDCGPVCADSLPAHGHGDSLSFEWSVGRTRLIVDAGVYQYHAGKERAYSRSTYAHNTLTLNDLDQSHFWASFRVGRRANTKVTKYLKESDGFTIEAYHDGYRYLSGKPIVRRVVKVSKEFIGVKDIVECNSKHIAKSRILLSPETRISSISKTVNQIYTCILSIKIMNSAENTLEFLLESESNFNIEEAVWNPDFGVKVNTKRITMEIGETPCCSCWSIKRI